MKYYIELSQEDYEFLNEYNSLSEQSKKMVCIICKIGASHILTSEEFHLLIQNLMHRET